MRNDSRAADEPRSRAARTNRPAGACKPEDECSATLQAEEPPKVAAEFQPLDPSLVSEAIPAFYIGCNEEDLDRPRRQRQDRWNFSI